MVRTAQGRSQNATRREMCGRFRKLSTINWTLDIRSLECSELFPVCFRPDHDIAPVTVKLIHPQEGSAIGVSRILRFDRSSLRSTFRASLGSIHRRKDSIAETLTNRSRVENVRYFNTALKAEGGYNY